MLFVLLFLEECISLFKASSPYHGSKSLIFILDVLYNIYKCLWGVLNRLHWNIKQGHKFSKINQGRVPAFNMIYNQSTILQPQSVYWT